MTDLLGSTTSPPAGAAPGTGAGTGGSFPQAQNNSPLDRYMAAAQQVLAGLTPGTFSSDYGVSPAEMPTFLDPSGKLNTAAQEWVAYHLMSQPDRQNLQDILVTAGMMKATDATGIVGTASNDAYRLLIGVATSQGASVDYMLTQINQGGLGSVQSEIQANLATAQKNATQPIVATVENPTTLSATITSAFENALGYSPDQAQISSFINQVQGQDTAYAQAPRTEAAAQLAMAHSEESALNKLGPDGIDTVIQAYQAAVSGTKLPGAGTTQGPQIGNITTGMPGQFPTPGTQMAPGNQARITPQGTEVGADTLPTVGSKTITAPGLPGGGIPGIHFGSTAPLKLNIPTYTTAPGGIAPSLPAGANTTKTYGGLYALSAADWKKAQADYAPAKKYATPGEAPQAVQLGAFSAVLQSAYDSTGSWSKAVASIASGSPFGTAEGTHLSTFGNQVAAEVNNQISALQNQVNNDTVTTKVSQPDATAEANLAAKQSDPSGYEAAQSASWGSVLNKMLSGTTSMYNQSASDTFTGPVSEQAMTTAQAAAPTTVGAGAP